jgi:hypothetical protein
MMLFLPPHNKVPFTSPMTFHFHQLFCYTSYLSLDRGVPAIRARNLATSL